MRVLISGSGIAGPTLAYWLKRAGFTPTLVELAPRLRTSGYVVDFWGSGFEVADRMGLVPVLRQRGYDVREVRLVNRHGRRVGGFPVDVFRRATKGRFVSVPRGDLAALLYEALEGKVETLFGETITGIEDRGRDVRVSFASGGARSFDLVIGADGLHSAVRRIAFGSDAGAERYLGGSVAAFEAAAYAPRDEQVYMMHLEVGLQVDRFSLRGDRTMFLFIWRESDGATNELDFAARKALLRSRFAGVGWECPAILDALDAADEVYFDRLSQIRIPRWSRGRVALVGDAAACPSLLAGEGSALAMAAAYVLAGELAVAAGDHTRAFARYEERLHGIYEAKQDGAIRFLDSFAPRSGLSLLLRTRGSRLLAVPWLADRLARAWLDPVELPAYAWSPPAPGALASPA
ncbi:MAG TPA: FAD-binding domain [Polyangiaceae bacterium]|jgi:2-polyprenyl-6-methoxyphenol hydroxylase-like FAD-dependent oxidoreductase